jgi:cytoskeletal protein RodZ
MEDQDNSLSTSATPRGVGEQLRAAREARGLALADVSVRTRVAERYLTAIEEDRFGDLAAPTYAVGFSRAYARAVGVDERDIAARVRRQLDAQAHTRRGPTLPSFEPGDPARVPPSRIAWLAGLLVVGVIAVLLVYWNDFLSPEGELPDLLPEATQTQGAAPVAAVPNAPPATAAAAPGGPVVLTAMAPAVWVKVTDSAGNQLFQKEMAQGESYTVPGQAQNPQLRTARADMLQVTVGGRALPRLSDKPEVISGVVLTPAALTQRSQAVGAPAPAATAQNTAPPPGQ